MESLQNITVSPEKFKMEALPELANYILSERLDDYISTMIRLSIREELPLLKKLDKLSYQDLVKLGRTSHGEILKALASHSIHKHIENNVRKWATNNLEVIDKNEVVAEDVTLSAYIKRKALQEFIPQFTDDQNLQKQLLDEIDNYTTQEELISYNTYMKIQQERLNKINDALAFQEGLLLEAQEISELGSFFLDYVNPEHSVYTPQTLKITGLKGDAEETFFSYIHPDDTDRVRKIWEEALEQGGEFDYSFRYIKDGYEKKLQSRGLVVKEDGQLMHVKGTLRDITKSDRLIRRLTQSEELHKEAQKLTHLGNWSWEIGSKTLMWSDEMYRIYGLEPQMEVITFDRFVSMIHPENRDKRVQEIEESVRTGIVKDYTLKIITPQGEIKILRGYGSIEKSANGKPLRLVGTCQDITSEYHLKNELILLNDALSKKNAELVASNKELESFNYIASHDLQEPLRKIQIYTEKVIHQTESLSPEARHSLEKVMASAARMRSLINDLMSFSQVSLSDFVFETIPLDQIVAEAIDGFSDITASGTATITADPFPEARIIRFQFLQLLSNIIGNAIKYRKDYVRATIHITNKYVTAEEVPSSSASGRYLKISVCDNGIGFDREYADTIFDLFKRLHANDKYSGTGIGLAICKKIAQNHNGCISTDSERGKGSCFHVFLPAE
ncbi:MAG TPA: PAS domain-containing protein [Flavobacterium sp.]|jgi:signal transduction histidine kinase